MNIFLKRFLFFSIVLSSLLIFVPKVLAVDFTPPPFKDSAYLGQFVSQSLKDPITINANEKKEVIIKIKNIGGKIWNATGANFVSVYTVDPNYRASAFACDNWVSASQAVRISKTVKVGETAEIKLPLCAPVKAGEYTERFYLAAENSSWIKSSYFYLKIKVVGSVPSSTSVIKDNVSSTASLISANKNDYNAKVIGLTGKYLTAENGGDTLDFQIKYQNLGKKNWEKYSLVAEENSSLNIKDPSWENSDVVLTRTKIAPTLGNSNWIKFKFKAPSKSGSYLINFYLTVDGKKIIGSEQKINLTVKNDAVNLNDNITNKEDENKLSPRVLIEEPKIRVRLTSPEGPAKFTSPYDYSVYMGSEFKGILPANTLATLNFIKNENSEGGIYSFKSSEINFSGEEKIRFVPSDLKYYFEVPTLARTITWKGETRFASYRGIMEYVYSNRSKEVYLVNELPMEEYVAGIGEMSDSSPYEYMKALIIAARSYAYLQLITGTPADQRTFDVYASTVDQLYLGYNHEIDAPNAVRAQLETAGMMVTYNRNPVVTPYYGHSDGRTRSWKEVWGGVNKPWLVSVPTPYDKGKKMFGHGVGISMDDAASHARNDGWDYEKILKYYYTGVEVEKIY